MKKATTTRKKEATAKGVAVKAARPRELKARWVGLCPTQLVANDRTAC
jgi:hypothetical protein